MPLPRALLLAALLLAVLLPPTSPFPVALLPAGVGQHGLLYHKGIANRQRCGMMGAAGGEDPGPVGDWREFRARLLAEEKAVVIEEDGDGGDGVGQGPAGGGGAWEAVARRAEGVSGRNSAAWKRGKKRKGGGDITWAHEIAAPESGCLVLARPCTSPDGWGGGNFARHTFLREAVIFIVQHNSKGSAGFVLNRPTPYRLGKLTNKLPGLEEARVYLGGDVGDGVQCVHGVEGLSASIEVREGIFMGLDPWHANELMNEGSCSLHDFKFFYRCLSWGPGQLERECEAGCWYAASTSTDVVLRPHINLSKPLWQEVMELMGGRYALAAKFLHGN